MTKTQLEIVKKALLEFEREKVARFDSMDKVEYEYSEKYNSAIAKLIKDQREKESSSLHLTYRQRIALLIATIILAAITITACANAEAIKDFVVEIIDHYASMKSSNPTAQFRLCEVNYIPEGFYIDNEVIVDDLFVEITWTNGDQKIIYGQSITTTSYIIDKDYEIIYIEGQKIYKTHKANSCSILWINDYGVFNIVYDESIPWEKIEMIYKSITPVECSSSVDER